MKRCDECGDSFGLIVYRHFARRFCKNHCKDLYLARLWNSRHGFGRLQFGGTT